MNMNKRCENTDKCQNTLTCLDGNCKCSDLEYWTEGTCSKSKINITTTSSWLATGFPKLLYEQAYIRTNSALRGIELK